MCKKNATKSVKSWLYSLSPQNSVQFCKYFTRDFFTSTLFVQFLKNRPLGRFFHRVAMSGYINNVPFSWNFFWGLSLALRSGASHHWPWHYHLRTTIFTLSSALTSALLSAHYQLCTTVCALPSARYHLRTTICALPSAVQPDDSWY